MALRLLYIRGFWSIFLAGGLTRSLTRWHAMTYPPPAYAYGRQWGHASCAWYSARTSSHRRHRAGWRGALWVGLEVRCEMEVRWAHKPRSSTKNKQKWKISLPELNSRLTTDFSIIILDKNCNQKLSIGRELNEIWHVVQIFFFCKKLNLSVNNKFLLLEPVSAMCLIIDTLLK